MMCDVPRLEDAMLVAPEEEQLLVEAIRALIRVAKAAARINELVGTETEDGQDVAWEELDEALRAVKLDESQNDDGRDT